MNINYFINFYSWSIRQIAVHRFRLKSFLCFVLITNFVAKIKIKD